MNDEELDAMIVERFKAYEAGMRLPEGFKGRFVGSVRRKRTLLRVGTLCLMCAAVAICISLSCAMRSDNIRNGARDTLMAKVAVCSNETSEVPFWALLGYLRDCFSRSRSKRREDDE